MQKLKNLTTFTKQVALPGLTALVLLSFLCILFPETTNHVLTTLQDYVYHSMSWVYVLIVSLILIFLVVIAFSKMGNIRLGPDNSRPQYSFFSWISMLFAAGMGIGLMYFGIGEPMSHYANPALASTVMRAKEAQLNTFFHWGIHAWALYAAMGLILAYFSYRYKLPLAIRSGLYPILKSKINGPIGDIVDIFALCSTFFGIAASLGFGAVQLNSGLVYLGVLDEKSYSVQLVIIGIVTTFAVASTLSGLNKGVKRLSELNMWLAVTLMFFVLALGPTIYLLSAFSEGIGYYFDKFIDLTFNTFAYEKEGRQWFTNWTVMFWAWWIAWAPFVGLFIARISRGRTIREFIVAVLLVPSMFVFLWMTVFGNGAIWVDTHLVNGALSRLVDNPDVLLFKFFESFPMPTLLCILAVMMISVFFVTSADSGILVMNGIATNGNPKKRPWQNIFWGVLLAGLSAALLRSGGLPALQSMTLITALPFGIVMLVLCYCLLKALRLDDLFHKTSLPYGSRNWDGSKWEERLDQILTFSQKKDIAQFMRDVVEPAFTELKTALEPRGVTAEIIKGKVSPMSIEILIRYDRLRNFRYGVTAEMQRVSDYFIEEDNAPDVEGDKIYYPVTYYNDGRRGNDIQYLNKEELIADVLREYERFITIIANTNNELIVIDP